MISNLIDEYKFTSLFVILLLLNTCLSAQKKYDFPEFGDETADFITRPIKWNLTDWAILGGIGSISYLLMHAES